MHVVNTLEDDLETAAVECVVYRSGPGRIAIAINAPDCTFRVNLSLLNGEVFAVVDIGRLDTEPRTATHVGATP